MMTEPAPDEPIQVVVLEEEDAKGAESLENEEIDEEAYREFSSETERLLPADANSSDLGHRMRAENLTTRAENQAILAENKHLRFKLADVEQKQMEMEKKVLEMADLEKKVFELTNTTKNYGQKIETLEAAQEETPSKCKTLPEDTFSFLLTSSKASPSFWLGTVVFVFQMAIFVLFYLDMLALGEEGNKFGIPANANQELRFTQFIAIIVAIFTQGDLLTSLDLFHDGYCEDLHTFFPKATRPKYLYSLLARVAEGAFGLFVTFLLIVTSDTVVNLLLSFTAIGFVSSLDDIFFFLSAQGFIGKNCKIDASKVTTTEYQLEKKRGRAAKIILLLSILTGLLVGLGVVVSNQNNGVYLCKTIFVQLGDDFVASMGVFSGLYDIQPAPYSPLKERRVEYVERRSQFIGTHVAKFSYCDEIGAWTFRWESSTNDESESCEKGWDARSSPTDTFDITDTAYITWYVRDDTGRQVLLNPFYLTCFDCKEDSDCGGQGKCGEKAVCSCDSGRQGLRCEHEPCTKLTVDLRSQEFLSTRAWATTFETVQVSADQYVESYNLPIYVKEYPSGVYDIILFTGRRWALTFSEALPLGGRISDEDLHAMNPERVPMGNSSIANFFKYFFHGHAANYSVSFLTEPMDAESYTDSSTPVGLQWFTASGHNRLDENQSPTNAVDTRLVCQICDSKSNPCLYDGRCVDGSCQCADPPKSGSLCEVPPTRNAHCDAFFNTQEFALDGGDCCSVTCLSTAENKCGEEESGRVSSGNVHCRLPPNQWLAHGNPLMGEEGANLGSAVALSKRGDVLVVAATGNNRIRLYDRDGADWVERPQSILLGDIEVEHMSVASNPRYLLDTSTSLTPLVVAVQGCGSVVVFFCEIRRCTETSVFKDAVAADISDDGSTVAVGLNHPSRVEVFSVDSSGDFRPLPFSSPIPTKRDESGHLVVALSGDGMVLTVVDEVEEEGFSVFEGGGVSGQRCVSGSSFSRQECCARHWRGWVLEYNGISYIQRGQDLFKKVIGSSFRLESVAMSRDGNSVALELPTGSIETVKTARVCSPDDEECDPLNPGSTISHRCSCSSNIVVMFWDGLNWMQQGSIPTNNGGCGYNRTFAFDGSMLAVGPRKGYHQSACEVSRSDINIFTFLPGQPAPPTAAPTTGTGVAPIEVFEWKGSSWARLGEPLPASSESVSLAIFGGLDSVLAVGLPDSGINRAGATEVYSLIQKCPKGSSRLRLSLHLHDEPQWISWNVMKNSTRSIAMAGDGYSESNRRMTTMDEACVARDECHVLTLKYGPVGPCFSPQITRNYGTLQYDLFLGDLRVESDSLNDGWLKQVSVGACSACPARKQLLKVLVYACIEAHWSVIDSRGMEVALSTTKVAGSAKLLSEDACVSIDECYSFTLTTAQDTLGTSVWFSIYLGDDLVANRTIEEGSALNSNIRFGSACTSAAAFPPASTVPSVPPTESSQPTQSSVPTFGPTKSSAPTSIPTTAPTPTAPTVTPTGVPKNVCLVVTMHADSNLEYWLRQDYKELSLSAAVRSPNIRTWVYYDSGQGGEGLPNTVDADGITTTGATFVGSRYVTFDRSIWTMREEVRLPKEQDSSNATTIQSFLEYALGDCLANGFDDLMMVFSGSSGGAAGFGSDDNGPVVGRLLPNSKLAFAIQSSLANTGGPDKLQVLGFDSVLMGALGAADDYLNVAEYLLASQSVTPGHGWAYGKLGPASSALELATQILDTFLYETQGSSSHQNPKTLSIVEMAKFPSFLEALETLSERLHALLQLNDVNAISIISRARTCAVAFGNILDPPGARRPSAIDIGSYLVNLMAGEWGDPLVLSEIVAAKAAYDSMFVQRGFGPGTPSATGMCLDWPQREVYQEDKALYDLFLFHHEHYATTIAPNFYGFLASFLRMDPFINNSTEVQACATTEASEEENMSHQTIGWQCAANESLLEVALTPSNSGVAYDFLMLDNETGTFEKISYRNDDFNYSVAEIIPIGCVGTTDRCIFLEASHLEVLYFPTASTAGRIVISVDITYRIGGTGDIPACPTEAELDSLYKATIEFYQQVFSASFNKTYAGLMAVKFIERKVPDGLNTNFLADVDFTFLPTTDDVVLAIENAGYTTLIIEKVLPIGPYFSSVLGLDLVARARVLNEDKPAPQNRTPGRAGDQFEVLLDGVVFDTITVGHGKVYIGNCLACPNGTTLFDIDIFACAQTTWSLVDDSTGAILYDSDTVHGTLYIEELGPSSSCNGTGPLRFYSNEFCLPTETCYVFGTELDFSGSSYNFTEQWVGFGDHEAFTKEPGSVFLGNCSYKFNGTLEGSFFPATRY
ncbi:peptidase C11, clostripain [Seminavis robusta]|uniref:Peptidase C11, clostripain n=1 Tax=Seminavis robusta TaxID=568900 RepID=A0A9N8ETA2_9STRA|nr:peptidase C11, clostripain [Seminavis robusta]|eukprot:Sro1812_g299260.1 peptidase C11, clostripain (2308) ;mRNA; r:3046-10464